MSFDDDWKSPIRRGSSPSDGCRSTVVDEKAQGLSLKAQRKTKLRGSDLRYAPYWSRMGERNSSFATAYSPLLNATPIGLAGTDQKINLQLDQFVMLLNAEMKFLSRQIFDDRFAVLEKAVRDLVNTITQIKHHQGRSGPPLGNPVPCPQVPPAPLASMEVQVELAGAQSITYSQTPADEIFLSSFGPSQNERTVLSRTVKGTANPLDPTLTSYADNYIKHIKIPSSLVRTGSGGLFNNNFNHV